MCWDWSGERTFSFLSGLLYKTFQFLLRLLKYIDWLFIHSFARVEQNLAERRRREVQAVRAEMQTRNALQVADVDKNFSVKMAKMRPSNGRMHRDYLSQSRNLAVGGGNQGKLSSRYRNVPFHNNNSFLFCLVDVCGESVIRGNGKVPYWIAF